MFHKINRNDLYVTNALNCKYLSRYHSYLKTSDLINRFIVVLHSDKNKKVVIFKKQVLTTAISKVDFAVGLTTLPLLRLRGLAVKEQP